MKGSKGFLLIETAAVFLLTGILLTGALQLYGSGIRLLQQRQRLEQSWQAAQKQLFCSETADGWQASVNVSASQGIIVKEVRMLDNEEKIGCNLLWVEK